MTSLAKMKNALNSTSLPELQDNLSDAIDLIESLKEIQVSSDKADLSPSQHNNGSRQLNRLRQALLENKMAEVRKALNEAIDMIEALNEHNAKKLAKNSNDETSNKKSKAKNDKASFATSAINIIKWSASASVSMIGFALAVGLSWQTTFLLASLALACFTTHEALKYLSSQQYEAYKSKTPKDIDELNDTQRASFHMGASAANSNQVRFANLFMWEGYRAPKAYYAGLQAGIEKDYVLLNSVEVKNKPSI